MDLNEIEEMRYQTLTSIKHELDDASVNAKVLMQLLDEHEQLKRQVRVGVALFLFNNEGQFLLMKRQGSHGAGTWGLPGGHLEFGEDVVQCAVREVYEELGVVIDISAVEILGVSEAKFLEESKHYVTVLCRARMFANSLPRISEPNKCEGLMWWSAVSDKVLPQPLFTPLGNYLKAYGLPSEGNPCR